MRRFPLPIRIPAAPATGLLLLLTLAALPAPAEIVVLSDGGVLKVDSYRVEEGRVRLALPAGGSLTLPLARIERVVDDELATDDPAPELEPESAAQGRFGFAPEDPVPDVPYGEMIWETASRHQVNPELVAAMVRAESNFDPRAVSHKGAVGLLQLMPATAERFGVASHRLFEPADNLDAGVRYLVWLNQRYPGDLTRILAAYNAGEANVDRHQGVPPFKETRGYIRRIYDTLGLEVAAVAAAR